MKPPSKIKVWDAFVRLFHWSLVVSFVVAWISAEQSDRVHEWSGYLIAALLITRIAWGFVGTKHARFSSFIYNPVTILKFLLDSLCFRAKRYVGHNPAGGAMIIALLVCLLVITTTGIMMITTTFWGIKWVEELHEITVNLTLGLIFLHLAGVLLASLEHQENLVMSMVTGWKRRNEKNKKRNRMVQKRKKKKAQENWHGF